MSDVLINHAFVSPKAASPDATKIDGPKWNAPLVLSGGNNGEILTADGDSETGADWKPPTWIDARTHGTVGDGETDDAAAIQAALTAAGVSGGTVYLPPGIYFTTTSLAVPSNVTLRGASPGITILQPEAGNLTMYDADGQSWGGVIVAAGVSHVTIRDLTVDLATNSCFANGVELGYTGGDVETEYATVTNVRVLGMPGRHAYQIWNRRARHTRILGNWIDGGDVTLDAVGVDHSGIEIFGATDVIVAHNTVLNLNGTGIGIFTNGANGATDAVIIAHNYIEHVTEGVGISAAVVETVPQTITDVQVRGNMIRDCAHTGISPTAPALGVIRNLSIVGNTITTALDPILLSGIATSVWTAILVAHNVITDATGGTPKAMLNLDNVADALVTGNVLRTGAYDGIKVVAGTDVQVVNNTVDGVIHVGIQLSTTVRTSVIDNAIRNWDVANATQAGISGSSNSQCTVMGNRFYRAAGHPSLVNLSGGDQNTVSRNKALYATSVVASFRDTSTNSSIGIVTITAAATSVAVTNTQMHFTSHVVVTQIAGAPKAFRVTVTSGSFTLVLASAAVGDEQFKYEIQQ